MRVIFIYSKKITIFLTIILFMIVMFGLESTFHDKLKLASLNENNIYKLKEYNDENMRIVYKLPENWGNSEKELNVEKVIYHSEFYDRESCIGGYIQLQKKNRELQDVVSTFGEDKSKIQEYNYRPIKVNGYKGYLVKYKLQSFIDKKQMKYCQYYIENDEERAVVTFYVADEKYQQNYEKIFDVITDTVKLK
ncbi:PsbP-related protein [Oceanirhabdus sp. W0125-5]|uniref:PsbP-related protein n=1 Tax=Oceanirhabdus sp. W0125-5 TaxID=2999116 RepID=UPI0022F2F2E2|nr:PsbP-related protein [Oceanirhabdus sp. W0125-5]WBW98295.1 PsbP-related protein [Oceanirhabdus sp. W0125-5]